LKKLESLGDALARIKKGAADEKRLQEDSEKKNAKKGTTKIESKMFEGLVDLIHKK